MLNMNQLFSFMVGQGGDRFLIDIYGLRRVLKYLIHMT
ncbi:uncharacterized protein METZ01_LOCUS130971 [marine metagenome]|uniref:Uncharacterized protein n=1 Tax=marine metagenome TaxID=408172 RepID=A0A381YNN6_9ZZZZ